MTVASETLAVQDVLGRVEEIEQIASTLPQQDDRRARLDRVARQTLAAAPPVRPSIAAGLLGLTEKTVRAWVNDGVLAAQTQSPTLRLDPRRLHEVWHLVRDLREAGKTRGLLDEVHRRLADQALLDRTDLQESLAQMRRGEAEVLIPRPAAAAPAGAAR
jgi:hypothetical protein